MRHPVSEDMRALDGLDLVAFAVAWMDMGSAIQEQVMDIVRHGTDADANPNAVEEAIRRIGGYNEEIDEALADWLQETPCEDDDDGGES